MGGSFVFNRLAELPPMLNGPEGQAFARAMGGAQDDELPLLRTAALSRLPYYCPDDALDGVGAWLKIERFPDEPNGTAPTETIDGTGYRGRLCRGWPTWEIAGSPEAIEQSLRAFGIPDVRVTEYWEWPTADGWYSKFYVFLGPDTGAFGIESLDWGEFNWGEGTWGSTATTALIRQIVGQILKWKSNHSLPVYVIVGLDGTTWGGFNWGDGAWGGSTVIRWRLANLWGNTVWGGFNWGNRAW